MFLLGNFQHQLDDKNRIRLPAKFRADLGDKYILMPGTGGCIYVYKADETQKILATLNDMQSMDPVKEEWIRSLVSEGCSVEADSQGRFVLPSNLQEIAGINKDVRVVGSISKVELWSEERWQQRLAKTDRSASGFDAIYKNLSGNQ
ncbi:MAG TPA: division/cell wall cluster transcriptional repressor MraZ [Candidatus Limihabitans stercoravium]|nr:division/cell wall cluster transcriptional repressor MraZ [Candidatus Limihabitans stercoravium]